MKIKLIIILFLLIGGLFASFNFSLAETVEYKYGEATTTLTPSPADVGGGLVPCGNGPNNPCTLCHFVIGFQNLINFMLTLVVTVGFVGIFASGVLYIISAGDEKLMGSAKSALSASLVGFAIVLGAWLIVNVTLWAFSAKLDMRTGGNWYTLECSTKNPTVVNNTTPPPTAPVIDKTNGTDGDCTTITTVDICKLHSGCSWNGSKCEIAVANKCGLSAAEKTSYSSTYGAGAVYCCAKNGNNCAVAGDCQYAAGSFNTSCSTMCGSTYGVKIDSSYCKNTLGY